MESLKDSTPLDQLRQANRQLIEFFARSFGRPVSGTVEEVEALRKLERALESIVPLLDRRLQVAAGSELAVELDRYRINLLRLRQELAGMQGSAVECRNRLASRREHVHAAQAWIVGTRGVI